MEILAFVTGVVQIGVIWAAFTVVHSPAQRRVIVTIAALSLALCAVGLLWQVLGDAGIAALGVWLLYGAIGLAVAVGVVTALRSQRTRFAWPQGRYQKYRSYRRI